jgi:hypothetical protein
MAHAYEHGSLPYLLFVHGRTRFNHARPRIKNMQEIPINYFLFFFNVHFTFIGLWKIISSPLPCFLKQIRENLTQKLFTFLMAILFLWLANENALVFFIKRYFSIC